MSKPEQSGSLLHGRYDPEFEADWDRRYEKAKDSMAIGAERPSPDPRGLETIKSVGNDALKDTVLVTPVQQELF
jgi:hypothetical protein